MQGIYRQIKRPLATEETCSMETVQIGQHRFLQDVKQKFLRQTAIYRQLMTSDFRLPNTAHGLRGEEKFLSLQ